MSISITPEHAQDGDVVLDPVDGSVYQYNGEGQWSHMQLVLTVSGPLWQPSGELILVARGGHPVEG
jgi:hypothetical protein